MWRCREDCVQSKQTIGCCHASLMQQRKRIAETFDFFEVKVAFGSGLCRVDVVWRCCTLACTQWECSCYPCEIRPTCVWSNLILQAVSAAARLRLLCQRLLRFFNIFFFISIKSLRPWRGSGWPVVLFCWVKPEKQHWALELAVLKKLPKCVWGFDQAATGSLYLPSGLRSELHMRQKVAFVPDNWFEMCNQIILLSILLISFISLPLFKPPTWFPLSCLHADLLPNPHTHF